MDRNLPLEEMVEGLAQKRFSSLELTEELLRVIGKENAELNDFLALNADAAGEAAKASDARRAAGEALGPLDGVPYAVKDVFLTKDIPTTAGSKILEDFLPVENATVVERLHAAGAVLLGKNNCDEFAMGASGEYSAYGPTKNPHDPTKVPGGSSSGSAAAVAAHHVPFAIGSDTNGSVRQPAAFCGLVGLKPTYGRISRYGLIALMSSADHVGVFTHTAEGAALVLQVLAGRDEKDATSSSADVPEYQQEIAQIELAALTIGIPKEYFGEGLDRGIADRIRRLARELEEAGARVVDVSLPHTQDALPTYYILNPAEASSNLGRYDGIRYSKKLAHALPAAGSLRERYGRVRGEGFGREPKRRIMVGNYVLSAEHQEKNFRQASKVRTLIRRDFAKAFSEVDLLLAPTTPTPAFDLGATQDPIQMYLADIYVSAASLAGLPAVTFPVGKIGNLPVGAQFIGKPFCEGRLLGAVRAAEQFRSA